MWNPALYVLCSPNCWALERLAGCTSSACDGRWHNANGMKLKYELSATVISVWLDLVKKLDCWALLYSHMKLGCIRASQASYACSFAKAKQKITKADPRKHSLVTKAEPNLCIPSADKAMAPTEASFVLHDPCFDTHSHTCSIVLPPSRTQNQVSKDHHRCIDGYRIQNVLSSTAQFLFQHANRASWQMSEGEEEQRGCRAVTPM